jgi:anti-sigma factor RsiW
MNFCEKYSGSIEDLIEGELDEQKAGRVESHVFECPKCRKQYETLRREKEIYAHYLFDAEPPKDLWTNFEARLAAEKEKASNFAADKSANDSRRRINIFGFWRLSPASVAFAVLLFVCVGGLIWLKIAPVRKRRRPYIAENQSSNSQLSPTKLAEIERRSAVILRKESSARQTSLPRKITNRSPEIKL